MAKTKKAVVISTAKKAEPIREVDYTKPGFSNVAPDSPQAKPFKRNEVLPSQINKE